jgi:hypothetical protein
VETLYQLMLIMKGDPDAVLSRCATVAVAGTEDAGGARGSGGTGGVSIADSSGGWSTGTEEKPLTEDMRTCILESLATTAMAVANAGGKGKSSHGGAGSQDPGLGRQFWVAFARKAVGVPVTGAAASSSSDGGSCSIDSMPTEDIVAIAEAESEDLCLVGLVSG